MKNELFYLQFNNKNELILEFQLMWHEHSHALLGGGREQHWELKATYLKREFKNHSLAVGFSYGQKYFEMGSQFFSNDNDLAPFESATGDWYEYSVFVEDIWSVTDRLKMTLGLRLEKLEQ